MRMFMYPLDAEIYGRALESREVLNAVTVTIGDVQYPAATIAALDSKSLAAIGIKEFLEDVVPEFYAPGDPVDVETDTTITRTYPNATPDEDAAFNAAIDSIEAEYRAKLATVQESIVVTLASDGSDMDQRLAERRADYQRILAARSAAIDALWGEE